MAKHSRDSMVVLAAPTARTSGRRRARAHVGAALGSRRGRAVSAAAMALCLAAAVGAGAAVGRSTQEPAQNLALVDATPTASAPTPPGTAMTTGSAPAAPAPSTPAAVPSAAQAAVATGLAAGGIPVVALQAYQGAAASMASSTPACGISWPLIAAIGRIESNHGRTSGALLVDGTSSPPVMGILLSGGNGFATIKDSDGGLLDGNAQYDRAIGPMQFIPSTWKMYASDANGDGKRDPFNLYDAALAAGKYLCRAGGDLRTGEGLQRAVYSYNHDMAYVNRVLALADEYAVAYNQNRLPITAVTGVPAAGDVQLPPATVGGGGAEEQAPSQEPTASAPTTDSGTPSDSEAPAEPQAPTDPGTPSTPGTPSDPGTPSESISPTESPSATQPPPPSDPPSDPPSSQEASAAPATDSPSGTEPAASGTVTP